MASKPVNSYTASQSRKSHKKSRLGCGNCKRRRIKCDEKNPECGNCLRHSVSCDYENAAGDKRGTSSSRQASTACDSTPEQQADDSFTFISSNQTNFRPPKRRHARRTVTSTQVELQIPTPEPSTAVANKPFNFSATDMALFHHLISSKDLGGSNQMAISQFTRLGFSFHYVLHLLLAISAFHLARHGGDNHLSQITGHSGDYLAEGERHYSLAVGIVAAQIPCLGKENGLALYAAALLIFLCSIAKGPQPREYLAFRDDGQAGSLSLFMGIRTVLETCTGSFAIDASVMHAADHKDPSSHGKTKFNKSWARNSAVSERYSSELSHLSQILLTLPSDRDAASYHQVFQRLQYIFQSLYGPNSMVNELELWPMIFGWLYTLPDAFLTALQSREPISLVLFAFFVMLLKELDSPWFLRDWPEHILMGIFHNLDASHQPFICWPMEVLKCSSHRKPALLHSGG
ncbi:hypothetical protein BDW72DRAFT_210613 [Aspergillus terricola var. indicus]